ncbi:rhomboid family intramembrane serine protease [Corallococcus sp. M34]|nr:rhomboid family intramembrane serine protease [Citreicoccus inhibens]
MSVSVPEAAPSSGDAAPPQAESFAVYLTRKLFTDKGYHPGTVPEAQALVTASDAVLTYSDGLSCCIVCIIDREREPSRRFTLAPEVVARVANDCLKYTGRVNGAKLPLGLHLIEVGKEPPSAADRERLQGYRTRFFSRARVSASYIDTFACDVWHNEGWPRSAPRPSYLRKLLISPRVESTPEVVAPPPERRPVLTVALLAAIVAVFGVEHLFPLEGEGVGLLGPSVQTLWGLGGLDWTSVWEQGQWWRLLTAPLLHADVFHLLLNGIGLGFAAWMLEKQVGRAWLAFVFVLGGVGGGLLSLAVNPVGVVSVGASGAIMGLLAAVLVLSQRAPMGPQRVQLQMGALRFLVPSLIPLATTRTSDHVDFAAHLGGALVGGLVGFVLTRVWRKQDAVPPGTRWVGALSAVAWVALMATGPQVARVHGLARLENALIPAESMPTPADDLPAVAPGLVARYPRDPRARLFQAAVLLDAGDAPGAEREIRAALAEREVLEHFFAGARLPLKLHEVLARALLAQNRDAEAREAVRPFCAAGEGKDAPSELTGLGLCETGNP